MFQRDRRRRRELSRSTAMPTTRCSGRRTPRSAAKRARCTSARASVSCSRCRGHAIVKYRLVDTVMPGQQDKDEATLFDGIGTHRAGLARFAGDKPPAPLVNGLSSDRGGRESGESAAAQRRCPTPQCAPLAAGLAAARELRETLPRSALLDEDGVYEIDFRVAQDDSRVRAGARAAQGLRLEALANDGVVTPGQPVKVTLIGPTGVGQPVEAGSVALEGLDGAAPGCKAARWRPVRSCSARLADRDRAERGKPSPTGTARARRAAMCSIADAPFGLPFRPTPFRAQFALTIGGRRVDCRCRCRPLRGQHLQRREADGAAGRSGASVQVHAGHRDRSTAAPGPMRTRRRRPPSARASHGHRRRTTRPARRRPRCRSTCPQGWRATPASAHVRFARPDEADTVRFSVRRRGASRRARIRCRRRSRRRRRDSIAGSR